MRVDMEPWFASLAEQVPGLLTASPALTYRVRMGSAVFYVVLAEGSPYLRALQAFYQVENVAQPELTHFTLYCLDAGVVENLPEPVLSVSELQALQQQQKWVVQQQIFMLDRPRRMLKAFDFKRRFGVFYAGDFAALPSWEYFSPLKELVHFLALEVGCWLIHAGSFAVDGRGILLVGPSGAGKSTTTLAAVQLGADTAGDDYVLVCVSGESCHLYPVFRTVKLHVGNPFGVPAQLEHYPVEQDLLTRKSVYFCNDHNETGPFAAQMELAQILSLQSECISTKALRLQQVLISSFTQMPYWLDLAMVLSRRLCQRVGGESVYIPRGRSALEAFVRERIHALAEAHA